MTEKIIYVAENGVKFEDKEECLSYEAEVNAVEDALRTIHDYCFKHRRFLDRCDACPFTRFCENNPSNWEIKDKVDSECIVEPEFNDVIDEEDI